MVRNPVNKPCGEGDKTAEGMMRNFAESGRPVFRASSALERGELKRKGKGVKTIHFSGSDDTIELILRTTEVMKPLNWRSGRFVSRISQILIKCRETRRK